MVSGWALAPDGAPSVRVGPVPPGCASASRLVAPDAGQTQTGENHTSVPLPWAAVGVEVGRVPRVATGHCPCSASAPAELRPRRQLSCSEDSDISSDDVLERTSQKSRREVGGPRLRLRPLFSASPQPTHG